VKKSETVSREAAAAAIAEPEEPETCITVALRNGANMRGQWGLWAYDGRLYNLIIINAGGEPLQQYQFPADAIAYVEIDKLASARLEPLQKLFMYNQQVEVAKKAAERQAQQQAQQPAQYQQAPQTSQPATVQKPEAPPTSYGDL